MLFKAEINRHVAQDENMLVEQLYIFLNEYVLTRLKYESDAEREDCVQDSIMYLLKRYHQLDEEMKKNLNLEKFFYNRAHSFMSSYISKLRNYRNKKKKYIEEEKYRQTIEKNLEGQEPEFVDYSILDPIVSSYKLEKEKEKLLKEFCEDRLKRLGYDTPGHEVKDVDRQTFELLLTLSYAVIDEYMIESTKEKANA